METHTNISPAGISAMLTVPEVAALIHKAVVTVRKMARKGALPGAKRVGRDWLFRRGEIQRFVEGKR
jgi:excisionase family DNA binding protein